MGITNPRVGELINDVEEGRLEVRPYFQRRQVWTNTDKEFFIDTVLRKFPFPEIFVCTANYDRQRIKRLKWLVDGQQRISTLRDYVRGSSDLLYKTVPRYEDLTEDQQTEFLDYEVAVRDLGTVDDAQIREIFRRINTTDYALKLMEVLNAMFSGAYKQYCETLSRQPFFGKHKVFSASAQKRMYDVTFCVTLVTTLLSGYYRRDEKNEEYLERYNDDFPQQDPIQVAIDRVFDCIERCGFEEKSRAWKQIDLFTLLVEIHAALVVDDLPLDPSVVGSRLDAFYKQVDRLSHEKTLTNEQDIPSGEMEVFSSTAAVVLQRRNTLSPKWLRLVLLTSVDASCPESLSGHPSCPCFIGEGESPFQTPAAVELVLQRKQTDSHKFVNENVSQY